jgi:hypothetical protein
MQDFFFKEGPKHPFEILEGLQTPCIKNWLKVENNLLVGW